MILRVINAYPEDEHLNVARIDNYIMEILGLSEGDTIEIIGNCKTVAKCMPLYKSENGKGIIRLNQLCKINTGVDQDEFVIIKKNNAISANSVTIIPIENIPDIEYPFVSTNLMGLAVVKGELMLIPFDVRKAIFQIVDVEYDYLNFESAFITQNTSIYFLNAKTIENKEKYYSVNIKDPKANEVILTQ